jgi:hypothetical protein
LLPQHHKLPSFRITHVCALPADISIGSLQNGCPSCGAAHPVAHAFPQAPQFALVVDGVSQPGAVLSQSMYPASQTTPHWPPTHVADPFSMPGQSAGEEHDPPVPPPPCPAPPPVPEPPSPPPGPAPNVRSSGEQAAPRRNAKQSPAIDARRVFFIEESPWVYWKEERASGVARISAGAS